MKRIDHATATVDQEFTEGNPGTGTAATRVTAQWLNVLQEEIAHVVEEAGIALDQTGVNRHQLMAALEALFTGVDFASDAEAFAGSLSNKAIVPSNFVKSFGTSGYARFPGGVILQWASVTVAVPGNGTGGETTATFPMTFPNAFLKAMMSREQAVVDNSWAGPYCNKGASSTSQIRVGLDEAATVTAGNYTATYLAIGH